MGFRKVRDAFSEFLCSNSACEAAVKFSDIIAAVVALLTLISTFVSLGGFIDALLPYVLLAAVMLSLASKGELGLLIITGAKTLAAFIGLIVAVARYSYLNWSASFAFAFWGVMTFFVVSAVGKGDFGESMLIDLFKSAVSSKAPARVCTSCGAAEKDSSSKFCKNCGAQFADASAEPVAVVEAETVAQPAAVCPKCGKTADDDAEFCTVCGTKLK